MVIDPRIYTNAQLEHQLNFNLTKTYVVIDEHLYANVPKETIKQIIFKKFIFDQFLKRDVCSIFDLSTLGYNLTSDE